MNRYETRTLPDAEQPLLIETENKHIKLRTDKELTYSTFPNLIVFYLFLLWHCHYKTDPSKQVPHSQPDWQTIKGKKYGKSINKNNIQNQTFKCDKYIYYSSCACPYLPEGSAGRNSQKVHGFTAQELPHRGANHSPSITRPAHKTSCTVYSIAITLPDTKRHYESSFTTKYISELLKKHIKNIEQQELIFTLSMVSFLSLSTGVPIFHLFWIKKEIAYCNVNSCHSSKLRDVIVQTHV